MAEYIERELAIKALSRGEGCGNVCRRAIERILAADVAPVVHGRWIDVREYCGDYMCSNCETLYSTNKFNYCPYCGVKMDGRIYNG